MSYLARCFCLICLLLFCKTGYSQKIILIDNTNNIPISDVTVFGKQSFKSIISNNKGIVDLEQFDKRDTLLIGHVSYNSIELINNSITNNTIIFLEPNTQALSEVILSVARSKESKEKISKQVSLITKKDLKLDLPQTAADLLNYASGVRVQKSQGGGGSPVIRGFEANRVLLVIDGVRMNNAIYRSGHLQNSITINPNSLERTEVIYGPSSVGYGSDALGGVVHYYTKTPKINNSNKWLASGISSYNSRLNNIIQNLDFEHSTNKWASYTNFSFSKFGDIVMGNNRKHGFDDWGLDNHYLDSKLLNSSEINNDNPKTQLNTAYSQFDFMQKFNILLSESSNMIVNFQHSKSSNINRFDKLNEIKNGDYKYSEWYYGPQKRTMISTHFNFSKTKKLSDKSKLLIAFQKIGESRHSRKFQDLSKTNQIENLNVFSINNDYFKRFSNNSSLAYGIEYTFNDVSSKAYLQNYTSTNSKLTESDQYHNIPTRYPSDEGHYSTAAVYYEYRKDISKKSNVNFGMRFTNTRLSAMWNDKNIINANISDVNSQNSSITSSLGYVLRTENNWKISANFSSGFRSPNIDDIGKIREQKGVLSVPNSKLKPEYAYNSEIGLSKSSLNKQNIFSLNAYYTHISKHISRDYFEISNDTSTIDTSTILFNSEEVITMANVNKGNAFIYGATLDLRLSSPNVWAFKANLTYTHGGSVDSHHPLPSISPLFGHLTLRYIVGKSSDFELSYRFSSSKNPDKYSIGGEDGLEETPVIFDGIDFSFNGMPSWGVVKLSSSYEFSNKFKTLLVLDNVFDIHYREFASGISAPGRNLNLVLSYKF